MTLNVHTGIMDQEQITTPPLKVKRLHPNAVLPTYGSDGAACFDLYAFGDQGIADATNITELAISTGIAVEIPEGWEMVIRPRSGLRFKNGIEAFQGTIDSDYRGEVKVLLDAKQHYWVGAIPHGTRIAQAKLQPAPRTPIIEVDELSDTKRGEGGFGSTGK